MNQKMPASEITMTKASQIRRARLRVCWIVSEAGVVLVGLSFSFLYFKSADISSMVLVVIVTMAVNATSESIRRLFFSMTEMPPNAKVSDGDEPPLTLQLPLG